MEDLKMGTDRQDRRPAVSDLPWAKIDFNAFARAMALNGGRADEKAAIRLGEQPPRRSPGMNDFLLKVETSQISATGFWFTVKWTGDDERRHTKSGATLALAMWEAAQMEYETCSRPKPTNVHE